MVFWIDCIKKFILDIIFPTDCFGCEKEGELVCEDCFQKIMPSVRSFHGENLDKIITFYSYDDKIIKNLIHGLKYRFVEDSARHIGKLVERELGKILEQIGCPDIFSPVPLHKKRYLERGFNQGEEIAKFLVTKIGWPLRTDILVRVRETVSQVSLKEEARKKNIEGAFWLLGNSDIKNKKIVLLDDVVTTGATMEECARVLKQAGAKEVLGLAFARG
ncbi:ComF family protein [Patescibacteria group bacterium]|nr:ComF family protein [Patescibacteria group bacterium]